MRLRRQVLRVIMPHEWHQVVLQDVCPCFAQQHDLLLLTAAVP